MRKAAGGGLMQFPAVVSFQNARNLAHSKLSVIIFVTPVRIISFRKNGYLYFLAEKNVNIRYFSLFREN